MRRFLIASFSGACLLGSFALYGQEIDVKNWAAPPYWTPGAAPVPEGGETSPREAQAGRAPLTGGPTVMPFVAMTPCRIVDTRGNGQTGAFGAPQMAANTSRTIPVPTHPTCTGIPATAGAYSLNITVTNTGSGAYGYLQAWPTGQTQPTSSTLNYPGAGATLANAAVVPAGTAGSIDVFSGNASADVIIDINGYYTPLGVVNNVNGLIGAVSLAQGSNVTITPSGQTLTIAATGGGAGTVSSVGTGAGLTGGPITTTGTVSVAPLGITTGMLADNAVTSAKLAPGAVGLAQVDQTQIQRRVFGSCPDGTMIQGVFQDGTVDCNAFAPRFGFSTATIDGSPDVAVTTSITIGTPGLAVISYYDNTNLRLKLALCNPKGTSAIGSIVVDSAGDVGFGSSIITGQDGQALISYYDATNGDLKVAHLSNDFSAATNITTLDSAGDVGFKNSLAIGQDGLGLIAYPDSTNGYLKMAHCSNVACTAATITTLDSSGNVGNHMSLAVGFDGLGLISYYDYVNGDLKVAHCSNVLCTAATITTLDSVGDVGKYNSIAVGWDGRGVISYFDVTNGHLKVARCADILCTSAATNTLDASPNVGNNGTSITIGSDFLPVISYFDKTNFVLKVAHCFDMACSSASFAVLDGGLSTHVGQWSSITIAPDGFPMISYLDVTNGHLKVAHCSNPTCTPYVRRR